MSRHRQELAGATTESPESSTEESPEGATVESPEDAAAASPKLNTDLGRQDAIRGVKGMPALALQLLHHVTLRAAPT